MESYFTIFEIKFIDNVIVMVNTNQCFNSYEDAEKRIEKLLIQDKFHSYEIHKIYQTKI